MQILQSMERRYKLLRIALILSISITAFTIPVIASSIATQQTTGHIRIVNGANAGLVVTPLVLDFGNVTWGQTITKIITVTNNGDCVEKVNATATQPSQIPVNLYIPALYPSQSMNVTATYDTKLFQPGDYSFGLDWIAACL